MDIIKLVRLAITTKKKAKVLSYESCVEFEFDFPKGTLDILSSFSGEYVSLYSFLGRYGNEEARLNRTEYLYIESYNPKTFDCGGYKKLGITLEQYAAAVRSMAISGNKIASEDVSFIRSNYQSQYFQQSVGKAFCKYRRGEEHIQ